MWRQRWRAGCWMVVWSVIWVPSPWVFCVQSIRKEGVESVLPFGFSGWRIKSESPACWPGFSLFPDLRVAGGVKVFGVEKWAGGAWLLGFVMCLVFSGFAASSIVYAGGLVSDCMMGRHRLCEKGIGFKSVRIELRYMHGPHGCFS